MNNIDYGITKYLKIMELFPQTDVKTDESFQRLFNGFYQVRRNAEWRKVYYDFMEKIKRTNPSSINGIISYLWENTPQNKVELSFSSKLLHTVNPIYPIYDRKVAEFFNLLPAKPYWDSEKKIHYSIDIYQRIIEKYQTTQIQSLSRRFDDLFPGYADRIGQTKKIDFIIWKNLYI